MWFSVGQLQTSWSPPVISLLAVFLPTLVCPRSRSLFLFSKRILSLRTGAGRGYSCPTRHLLQLCTLQMPLFLYRCKDVSLRWWWYVSLRWWWCLTKSDFLFWPHNCQGLTQHYAETQFNTYGITRFWCVAGLFCWSHSVMADANHKDLDMLWITLISCQTSSRAA